VEHVIVYLQQDKKAMAPPRVKSVTQLQTRKSKERKGGASEFFFSSTDKKQSATAVEVVSAGERELCPEALKREVCPEEESKHRGEKGARFIQW